jgi:methionyl aminopeptidase
MRRTRIRELGGNAQFQGLSRVSWAVSVPVMNDEVVHGIPRQRKVIRAGRRAQGRHRGLLTKGFHGDSCITIPVGQVTPPAQKLDRGGGGRSYTRALSRSKPATR